MVAVRVRGVALEVVAGPAIPSEPDQRRRVGPVSLDGQGEFLGAIASLETLRPLLAQSQAPRAVAVSSFAALTEVDPDLLSAFRARDEDRAIEVAQRLVDSDRDT